MFHPRSSHLATTVLALLGLASAATADSLVGRVVDPGGAGVAGAQIRVENLAGPDPVVTNDETDALGFFNATVPAGLYRILVVPPTPPVTTLLIEVFEDQFVLDTHDLGTVVLEAGFGLSGRIVDSFGSPVVNVDLDVIDEATGIDIELSGDNSDLLGNFHLAVPAELSLQLDPSTISPLLPTLAPQELRLSLAGPTNLGDLVLQPGFTLSGVVLDPSGFPVVNADLDVDDVSTGQEIYTPGDNTDNFGVFSVVVPAGLYDAKICPPAGTFLRPAGRDGLTVTNDFNGGLIFLKSGVLLTGSVTDCFGNPVAGADIDVERTVSGRSVTLCGDNTDLFGNYSVVGPTGTLDVTVASPDLGTSTVVGAVFVGGPTVVNASLPCCAPGSVQVRNGSGTNPLLFTSLATPTIGASWTGQIDATGFAPGFALVVGVAGSLNGIPTAAGELLIDPNSVFLFSATASHAGAPFTIGGPIPNNPGICGRPVHAQAVLLSSPGPAFTNALVLTPGQ